MGNYTKSKSGKWEFWDVTCPYCESREEICHDDGQGYEEDRPHEGFCSACEKNFIFYTTISYDYEPKQADCLNGGDHDWRKPRFISPYRPDSVTCSMCDWIKEGKYVWPDDQPKKEG